jgi:hypothetical protein
VLVSAPEEDTMTRRLTASVTLVLTLGLSGCLGTIVETPTQRGGEISGTHPHILAAPFRVEANGCAAGISRVATFIPLWGVAVGILTIGIIVPKATTYSCVTGSAR